MQRSQINKINVERLTGWKNKLNDQHATPVLLMGIGHDQNEGQMSICVTEDMDDTHILLFLKEAVRQQEQRLMGYRG